MNARAEKGEDGEETECLEKRGIFISSESVGSG